MLFKEGWKPSVTGQAGLLPSWRFQTSEGARQTDKPVADVTYNTAGLARVTGGVTGTREEEPYVPWFLLVL